MHTLIVDNQANAYTSAHSDVAQGFSNIIVLLCKLVSVQGTHVHICINKHLIWGLFEPMALNEMLVDRGPLPRQFGCCSDTAELITRFVETNRSKARNTNRKDVFVIVLNPLGKCV